MTQHPNKPHVVVYFTDAGGGHRSAAEAIIEALHKSYGDCLTTEMVDFFRSIGPQALRRAPDLYPALVRTGLWQTSFKATDGRSRARVITTSLWPTLRQVARQLVNRHPADLVVTVHALANSFVLKALGKHRPPFYTVVTDFGTIHALWFDKRADHIFVPAEAARERGIKYGMAPEKLEVVGFPVAERYCAPPGDKRTLRENLGWPLDKAIALVVGGGEGMGPLAKFARAIDESGLDLGLVIVAGRNQRLKETLESYQWENQTFIYGFTNQMPEFMHAADILVSKAGGATVAEALNAGLPMVLYARLAGQEEGNVTHLEQAGAGVYAPKPNLVVRTLTRWISRPNERKQVAENARRAARPDSARRIARAIGEKLGLQVKISRGDPPGSIR